MSSLVMVKQWDKILAEVLPQTLSALFFKEPVFSHIAPLPLLSLTLASHLASELLQELASCLLLPFLPSVCSQHSSQSHPSASSQQPPLLPLLCSGLPIGSHLTQDQRLCFLSSSPYTSFFSVLSSPATVASMVTPARPACSCLRAFALALPSACNPFLHFPQVLA